MSAAPGCTCEYVNTSPHDEMTTSSLSKLKLKSNLALVQMVLTSQLLEPEDEDGDTPRTHPSLVLTELDTKCVLSRHGAVRSRN